MSKKLYIGLAPLIVIAAFAMTPVAAQALTPHWFVDGSPLTQGEPVKTLSWGELTLESEPAGIAAPITCDNVVGGTVENPVGATKPAGVATTAEFVPYNCRQAECPLFFTIVSPPQFLPWPGTIIGTGPFKLNSTGVVVELACTAKPSTRGAAPNPGQNELQPVATPTICETNATHLQDPQLENGTNKGPGQSKAIFNQPAGSGLSCAGGVVTGKISESLKTMGYLGSELITVKNS